ncbi:MAG: hypothetical protein ACRDJI_04905 [Actinomycetota bacterium]
MSDDATPRVLIVVADDELPKNARVWGTGGWNMPHDREGLDWLTMFRLLGWDVAIAYSSDAPPSPTTSRGLRCVVIASAPDELSPEWVGWLEALLAREPALVVTRAPRSAAPMARLSKTVGAAGEAAGRELLWRGPGGSRTWSCSNEVSGHALAMSSGVDVWASLDGAPWITAARCGRGVIATLGFHPSAARDQDGHAGALLRHLVVAGPGTPTVWFDFESTLVLRMDDPGGAQNVHWKNWRYPKLDAGAWQAVVADLERREARMSIGYVSGWVDDGDARRGHLAVAGEQVERVPGRVHPSPLVTYTDVAGHAPGTAYDYAAEFRGIQMLRSAGRGDVELHGFTHIHPDTAAWARAPDRYENESWYRELGRAAEATIRSRSAANHPLSLGVEWLRRFYGVAPTTLISPGDEWTNAALEHALDLGIQLVDSYYMALRDGDRFCWSTHVCSPYLDVPAASWFDSGLPVVGYLHDYEPAREGVGWMTKWLDQWQSAGADRLIDFRELASAVGRSLSVDARGTAVTLRSRSERTPALVRPLRLLLHVPGGVPARCSVALDDHEAAVDVERLSDDVGRIEVEAPAQGPRDRQGFRLGEKGCLCPNRAG